MTPHAEVLAIVKAQIQAAIEAPKCHRCGCLVSTLQAMGGAAVVLPALAEIVAQGQAVLEPQKYECLGCELCYPAVAANALSESFPEALSQAALCPTQAPATRRGWPPLPGHYSVLRYGGCAAVCTLNSDALADELARRAPQGLAIVGTMHTENLGIERVVRNVIANPNIRFLVLCGEDTRRPVGHLPGQSLESLFANGIDAEQRIVGAQGRRPLLKNLSAAQVAALREQVSLVSLIGEQDVERIVAEIGRCHAQGLPRCDTGVSAEGIPTVQAVEPQFFKSDPAGFFVIYPDAGARELVVEHYTNAAVLDCVVAGRSAVAVYCEIVKRQLVSQLDHAAYLGRELAIAERSLRSGEPYVQDRAPGKPLQPSGCSSGCTSCH